MISLHTPSAARLTRRLVALALVVAGTAVGALRVEARAGDDEARATTIARMLRFVEWNTKAPGTGLRVAVVGNAELSAALREACAAIQPGGHTVTVVDVPSVAALADVKASVVVLGEDSAVLARRLSEQGVVTVGDGDCPENRALALNIRSEGDRYRLQANPTAAARAGVVLSSRLLRLAQIVN
ncbi:hypothetical protein TBR22_A49350 [Luteitalea sp. TBR-22]|uniref:YfiR family protein n=1 Tax=Luteitalea sp. TBR-22 TaxID=2802971 RepID=UPI001AF54153|nr:YfiR family protein [Luteitalea sp. TBR-22]BCS35701.1 hypothetical protein TBR22_A49350 [Luteitalea sp. TBR-22]